MPGGGKTGPLGNGPTTGRGAGFCAGYMGGGYQSAGFGRGGLGFGRGMGRGRGRGLGFAPRSLGSLDDTYFLKEQAVILENELRLIKERISQIEPHSSQVE